MRYSLILNRVNEIFREDILGKNSDFFSGIMYNLIRNLQTM